MPGPTSIFLSCRETISALERASDVAAEIDTPYTMFRVLPSAYWRDTLNYLLAAPSFWVCVFVLQLIILMGGVQTAILAYEVGSVLDSCRDLASCRNAPSWATWVVVFDGRPFLLFTKSLILFAFAFTSFIMQPGWIAVATYSAQRTPLSLLWLYSLTKGCAELSRAGWLGLLPMRFVAMFSRWRASPFSGMDWRWRIMILGRLCHFTMLALIAKGVSTPLLPKAVGETVAKHHREMLDSFGTYNLIFAANVIAVLILLVGPSIFGLPLPDFSVQTRALIVWVLCIPMVLARILMVAHFSRVVNGHFL